jgi:hypothetical protein
MPLMLIQVSLADMRIKICIFIVNLGKIFKEKQLITNLGTDDQ